MNESLQTGSFDALLANLSLTVNGKPRQELWDVDGNFNINALRTNTTLRKDEWEQLDTAIVDIARKRLVAVGDLESRGLVHNLRNIGVTISQYEQQSDMTAADVDMDGQTAGEEDRVTFTLISVPIPVVHKNFRLGNRVLAASRTIGEGLDLTQATVAARRVSDKLEELVYDGSTAIVVNGNALYGYTTATNRNTVSGSDWGTIGNIITDIESAVAANEADSYYGPYVLYVATVQYGQLRAVYTDGTGETAHDRILRTYPMISDIKPGDQLTAGEAILIQMERDVVDLAKALDLSTVEWTNNAGFTTHFKVWAVMAPRVKDTSTGQSGICHVTGI